MTTDPRRRAAARSSGSTIDNDPPGTFEDDADAFPMTAWATACMEARSVTAWAVSVLCLRVLVAAAQRASASQACRAGSSDGWVSALSYVSSAVLRWLLYLLPGRNPGSSPGFIFSAPWLLSWIHTRFGVLPNFPLRICDMLLKRISPRELAIVLPIHFACTLSTTMLFNRLLPDDIASLATAPIEYSNASWWLLDFGEEMAVNAALSVGVLVLPELLSLNKIPVCFSNLILYPLFTFGVDADGKGSALSPSMFNALETCHGRSVVSSRILGGLAGGLLGGKIMTAYFPDDPQPSWQK